MITIEDLEDAATLDQPPTGDDVLFGSFAHVTDSRNLPQIMATARLELATAINQRAAEQNYTPHVVGTLTERLDDSTVRDVWYFKRA